MKEIVAFDIDTTGLDKRKDRIIKFAAKKFKPVTYEIIDEFLTYIKPDTACRMSMSAFYKHGITFQFLEDKPTFGEVAQQIIDFVGDCDILTFNGIHFDIPFLSNELNRYGLEIDFLHRKCYDSLLVERRINTNSLEQTYKRYTGKTMTEDGLVGKDPFSDITATISVFCGQNGNDHVEPEKVYGDDSIICDREVNGAVYPCFTVGRYCGVPVSQVAMVDKGYLSWAISDKCNFNRHTKEFLSDYVG